MDLRRPLRLECGVQHYDWGERAPDAYIPRLIGRSRAGEPPYAELWIGAHPVCPAQTAVDGERRALTEVIAAAPVPALGADSVRRFGPRLPFLLKVLAAERMLSIQAHPDKRQAEEGFTREEAAGVPRGADHRRYRDDNHKPELIVALGEFYALCGFRPVEESVAELTRHASLRPVLEAAGGRAATIESLFTTCMTLPAATVDAAVGGLMSALAEMDRREPFTPAHHEHWLMKADRQFAREGRHDRGVLGMLLLNLVHLAPGQALFLGPGELHSYLQGVGVELMANSDNVLRGGLTSKHVDVPELRRILKFRAGPVEVLEPDARGVYPTPAPEFQLTVLELAPGARWRRPPGAPAPDVLLAVEGTAVLRAPESASEDMPLTAGATCFVSAAMGDYELQAVAAARLFRASVPPRNDG